MNNSQGSRYDVCEQQYYLLGMLEPNFTAPLGVYRQHVTVSNSSLSMDLDPGLDPNLDPTPTALGVFCNHDAATAAGSNLECTKVRTEWTKPKSLAVGPPSQVPSTGRFVFDSSMKALAPRRLRSRSRADKDAALHLRRTGGVCPTHKASEKNVSQGLRDLIPALTYSEVSLSHEVYDIEGGIGRRNRSKSFCRFRHPYSSWASE